MLRDFKRNYAILATFGRKIFSGCLCAVLFADGNVAGNRIGAVAEKVVFHLLRQILAGSGVGQAETVLVDEHGLVARPSVPCFLGNVFENALAQFVGQRREFHAFGFFAEFDAMYHAAHLVFS